ncbi:hypothetical protein BNJ_00107 [Kaumoebavirus]|uniref:hypothetical protein n=1 Tax=Kaumoebavirus TaxID=1859492 RepID=UPI0009C3ACB9|nr:hypothetical protein BNJ_00107 [Kaumoebavirus]ARA71943.1 hypothetical protein BNJ_00107 [Kaumoebavirus]
MDTTRLEKIIKKTILKEFGFLTLRFNKTEYDIRPILQLDDHVRFMLIVEGDKAPVTLSLYKQVCGNDVTDDDYWEIENGWKGFESRMQDVAEVLREDPDIKVRKGLHDTIASLRSELEEIGALISILRDQTPQIKMNDPCPKKYLEVLAKRIKKKNLNFVPVQN